MFPSKSQNTQSGPFAPQPETTWSTSEAHGSVAQRASSAIPSGR